MGTRNYSGEPDEMTGGKNEGGGGDNHGVDCHHVQGGVVIPSRFM